MNANKRVTMDVFQWLLGDITVDKNPEAEPMGKISKLGYKGTWVVELSNYSAGVFFMGFRFHLLGFYWDFIWNIQ